MILLRREKPLLIRGFSLPGPMSLFLPCDMQFQVIKPRFIRGLFSCRTREEASRRGAVPGSFAAGIHQVGCL